MRMKMFINRKGMFTIDPNRTSEFQCGREGLIQFTYDVTICSTNRTLDKNGFIIDNAVIDDYFNKTYTKKKSNEAISSCELIAQDTVKYFHKYLEKRKIEILEINVIISGSEHSRLTASWEKSTEHSLNYKFGFGKNNGRTIKQIIDSGESDYIHWVLENIPGFHLDDEAEKYLKKQSVFN